MKQRFAIILIGPQGSGKGTQASLLCKSYHMCYIAGGNIARELAKQRSELGHEVRNLMNEGKLLPDHILNEGVAIMIDHCTKNRPLLLDGYPRTLSQAHFLDELLKKEQISQIVIELDLDDAESVRRIQGRFVCSHCGSIIYTYAGQHLSTLQSRRQARHVCIHCGGSIEHRSDDTEGAVLKRLALYHRDTQPVLDFLTEHAEIHHIDARPSIEVVYQSICQKVSILHE